MISKEPLLTGDQQRAAADQWSAKIIEQHGKPCLKTHMRTLPGGWATVGCALGLIICVSGCGGGAATDSATGVSDAGSDSATGTDATTGTDTAVSSDAGSDGGGFDASGTDTGAFDAATSDGGGSDSAIPPPPSMGPYGPDMVELEPGRTVLDIATLYAPIWYHDSATGGPDNLGARADFPTSVDYDADLQHNNNWDNLVSTVPWSFIYYGLVATSTHFFLTYSHYHPRDWELICTGLFSECHEGDMESVRIVVRRVPGPEEVVAVQSHAHGDDYYWNTETLAATSGGVSVEGFVDFEDDVGGISPIPTATHTHLRVYAQEYGHGPIPCRAWESEPFLGYLGFGPSGIRCQGVPGEPGFSSGSGFILFPDNIPVPYNASYTSGMTIGYGLLNDEATLWQWKDQIGTGMLWRMDGAFTYVGGSGDPMFTTPAAIGARYDVDQFINDLTTGSAPWRVSTPGTNEGDMFFDPAWGWLQLLTFDHTIDPVYTYNPYIYPSHATPP